MKEFYYIGQDYLKRQYKEFYTQVSRCLMIKYTTSGDPYFNYKNKRYRLDKFLRTSSAWFTGHNVITDKDGNTVLLSGIESDNYFNPLFIEICDGGESVRLYQYKETITL